MNTNLRLPNKHAMIMPPCSLIQALVAALLLALSGAPPSIAHPAPQQSIQNPDNPVMVVDLGIDGVVWPNRWVPATIILQGGNKPFEGTVTVSYNQDERTGARLQRNVAATPGKTSTFHVLLNVPANCSRVMFSLHARGSFRATQTIVFSSSPRTAQGELYLTPIGASTPIVLGLGNPSDQSLNTLRNFHADNGDHFVISADTPRVCYMSPAQLPPSWAALDSVVLAVTTSDAARAVEPRVLAAVREWVSAGGRLVILANSPDEGWKDWLAAPGHPLPISVHSPQSTPPSPELIDALAHTLPGANTAAAAQRDDLFPPAAALQVRPLSLTEHGKFRGWSIRHPLADDPNQGILAEGPHGFGWVVVLGFHPPAAAATVSNDATRRVWRNAVNTALADFHNRQPISTNTSYYGNTDKFQNGGLVVSDVRALFARNSVLASISDIPAIGHSVFIIIAVGLLILALLLGPFDAFVLRKLRVRHRSWGTALAWIGLASLLAYFVPRFYRSEESLVNSLSVVDAWQSSPDPAAATAPAWRTTITGVFAGSSIDEPLKGDFAGSWWKSIIPARENTWGGGRNSSPHVTIAAFQSMPDPSAVNTIDDPWGGLGAGRPGDGGNLISSAPFKVWTLRTFQDQGREETPLRAMVRRENDSWRVELRGVPADAAIASSYLRTSDGSVNEWRPISFTPEGPIHVAVTQSPTATPIGKWLPIDLHANPQTLFYATSEHMDSQYSLPLLLPGPDQRALAIDHAVHANHAVLYLALRNMPPRSSIDLPAKYNHTQICRLVVPLSPPIGNVTSTPSASSPGEPQTAEPQEQEP